MITYRHGARSDLFAINEIYNHYIRTTPITFDIALKNMPEREAWFKKFAPDKPHQLWVALNSEEDLLGFAHSSRFRDKDAYQTSVETTIIWRRMLPAVRSAAGCTARCSRRSRHSTCTAHTPALRCPMSLRSRCTRSSASKPLVHTSRSDVNSTATGMCCGCRNACANQRHAPRPATGHWQGRSAGRVCATPGLPAWAPHRRIRARPSSRT